MNAAALPAPAHRHLAGFLLLAAALHAALLLVAERAYRPAPRAVSVVDLAVAGIADASAQAAAPALEPEPESAPAPEPADAPPQADAVADAAPPQRRSPSIPTAADAAASAEVAPAPLLRGASVLELARAVAALERPAVGAPQPGVARIDDLARPPPAFAAYFDAWRREVERVGQLNYPAEARAQGISGRLRLLAVVHSDGSLARARVVESSGVAVLDEAAMRIVHLAAPFAPFSPRMKDAADELRIEGEWNFLSRRGVTLLR